MPCHRKPRSAEALVEHSTNRFVADIRWLAGWDDARVFRPEAKHGFHITGLSGSQPSTVGRRDRATFGVEIRLRRTSERNRCKKENVSDI